MCKRIVVIGAAGAGKSTLARAIADQLGIHYIARDAILGPGQSSPEHRAAVDQATRSSSWVFDGTPFDVEDVLYPRACTVVFLDYSRTTVTWRALRRAMRILLLAGVRLRVLRPRRSIRRPDGPHQPENPWRWLDRTHPVRWSWSSHPRRRAALSELMVSPALAHTERLRFGTPRTTATWLRTLAAGPQP